MLSYQHGYHAGNFADVVKHLTLSRILTYMTQKDKPLFYLETHSGRGLYDLRSGQANKTGEYIEGIDILWKQKASLPDLFEPYMKSIANVNAAQELRYYPGSPQIAIDLLRPQDRIYCCELHPKEFESLQLLKHQHPKLHLSQEDGLKSLNALLPPSEKRGLIFIDPSFELKDEYKTIPSLIQKAHAKFSNGVYCLWFPLVNKGFTEQLYKGLEKINAKETLLVEFYQNKINTGMMTGCGLWILNPPFQLKTELKTGLEALQNLFNPEESHWVVK